MAGFFAEGGGGVGREPPLDELGPGGALGSAEGLRGGDLGWRRWGKVW